MEKAQRAKREQQEAAQEEQAKRNEQEAAEHAERDYERLISSKQASLPEEAPSSGPDTVAVMVRLPNGTRASRRCHPVLSTDALSHTLEQACPLVSSVFCSAGCNAGSMISPHRTAVS